MEEDDNLEEEGGDLEEVDFNCHLNLPQHHLPHLPQPNQPPNLVATVLVAVIAVIENNIEAVFAALICLQVSNCKMRDAFVP